MRTMSGDGDDEERERDHIRLSFIVGRRETDGGRERVWELLLLLLLLYNDDVYKPMFTGRLSRPRANAIAESVGVFLTSDRFDR